MANDLLVPIDSPKKQAKRQENRALVAKLSAEEIPRKEVKRRPNQSLAVRLRADGTPWTYSPPRPKIGEYRAPKIVEERPRYLVETPQDAAAQNNLASDLLAWANTDTAEAIEQFPLNLKMNPYKFYRIAETNAYFSDCLESAMAAIGFRRERAARTRKEDSATIMKMQPLYNKQYRELSLQKSSAEATKVGTIIQVVEGKIPDSDMVPKRVESDN